MIRRRNLSGGWLTFLYLAFAWVAPGCAGGEGAQAEVTIGYQKTGSLNLLRLRGGLEPALAKLGVQVKWVGFPAGPQLLEALNAGSIDFGHTGDAPPILAQAAGVPFVYVGYEPARPRAEAILVPAGSPLKSVAELKGKRIALNKGSNVHYLLVRALERAGVRYDEVRTVFLPPADARAAFEGGASTPGPPGTRTMPRPKPAPTHASFPMVTALSPTANSNSPPASLLAITLISSPRSSPVSESRLTGPSLTPTRPPASSGTRSDWSLRQSAG